MEGRNWIFAGLLCLSLASSAMATSLGGVQLKSGDVYPRQIGRVYLGSTNLGQVYVGPNSLQFNAAPGTYSGQGEGLIDLDAPTAWTPAWCIEVVQHAPGKARWYDYELHQLWDAPVDSGNTVGGMSEQQAQDLSKLFGLYATAVSDANTAAAFQAAVWEIVHETSGTWGLGGGQFRVSAVTGSGWVGLADSWLNSLAGVSYVDIGLRALVSPVHQDFALVVPGLPLPPPPVMPEPLTVAGVMLGCSSLIGYVRRRRRV